jgi:hypothetical protein
MINFIKIINLVFISILVAFFVHTNISIAQSSSPNSGLKNIIIEISSSPTTPLAGGQVNFELSSLTSNIDSMKIEWFVDGEIRQEGLGLTTFSITAKNNGQNTNVKAVASEKDGSSGTAEINILPAEVNLIVENQSFAPPFYKGGTYFTNQSATRIVAMPNILDENSQKVSSKNLVFKWTQNGTVLGSSSGTGKDSILIYGSIPISDIMVKVEIFDLSGQSIASRSLILKTKDPQILFYENNSLYGILFNRAVRNYYLGTREELKITAEPFSYSFNTNRDASAKYSWSINQNPIGTLGNKNEIILKQTDTIVSGIAQISLNINNTARIFQYSTDIFNVHFGQ